MKSRITRTTITIMSVGGLFLLGLLIFGLTTGRVNAQRVNSTFENREDAPVLQGQSVPLVAPAIPYQSIHPAVPTPQVAQPFPVDYTGGSTSFNTLAQPIIVTIKGGPELRGEPVHLGMLQVKTVFGPVSIPIDRIAGVRSADDSRQPATICLKNGDSLTGELAADSITIRTEWGTATIERGHIVSLVTSAAPATWQQHEGRWKIVPVAPATPASEPADSNKQVGGLDAGVLNPEPVPSAPATLSPEKSHPASATGLIKAEN